MDLTGGSTPSVSLCWRSQPADPEMRESVNAWVWDEGDASGCPARHRGGRGTVGNPRHPVQPGPRRRAGGDPVGPGSGHDPLGADGRPRILGAGRDALRAGRALRPLRTSGTGTEITVDDQVAGWFPGGEGRPGPGTSWRWTSARGPTLGVRDPAGGGGLGPGHPGGGGPHGRPPVRAAVPGDRPAAGG